MAKNNQGSKRGERPNEAGRKYLSQADVPAHGLFEALRVPQAIADSYGKSPTKPLRVAEAMGLSPSSGRFRMLTGAAIAYGLTDGGAFSEMITLTPLGRRIVAPVQEGDDEIAKREAFLRPRVVGGFLQKYNQSRLPAETIAKNVLEEMGVPPDRTEEVFALIVDSAKGLGMIREMKGASYVDIDSANLPHAIGAEEGGGGADGDGEEGVSLPPPSKPAMPTLPPTGQPRNSKVFITHGSNREIVGQLKDLLTFGGFVPTVAVEHETASKPVPEKVMDEMRTCGAAIIHVGNEKRLLDSDGKEHRFLNQNVLIEIGAAMALYGKKFILLVEKDVSLPSNLQGLYEVRYEGGKLDYEATMKLLKAFNDFRA